MLKILSAKKFYYIYDSFLFLKPLMKEMSRMEVIKAAKVEVTKSGDEEELKEDLAFDENICAICFNARSDLTLDCLHAFCTDCIQDWTDRQKECPLCRLPILQRISVLKKDSFDLIDKDLELGEML